MAVSFYCGSPGAGKSYHVVRHVIIKALGERRKILTNLPLKLKEIYEGYPKFWGNGGYVEFLQKEEIKDLHLKVDNPQYAGWLIIIDEAHDYWPSSEPCKNEQFRSWLSQHRHKFQDLILITQDFANLSKYIRSLVKERFEFEKNDSRGSEKTYMQDFYLKGSKKRSDREIRKYDSRFFDYYNSHDIGLAGHGFKEKRTGKKMNLMRLPYLIIGGGLLMVIFSVGVAFSQFNKGTGKAEKLPEKRTVTSGIIEPVKSGINQPFKPMFSGGSPASVSQGFCNKVTIGAWAGVGAKQSSDGILGMMGTNMEGGQILLKGEYTVIGVLEMPGKVIFIVRNSKKEVFRLKFEHLKYELGQRICL